MYISKKFEERIIRERVVDTEKYRYTLNQKPDRLEIIRLPLNKLDTTAALNEWETVKTIY